MQTERKKKGNQQKMYLYEFHENNSPNKQDHLFGSPLASTELSTVFTGFTETTETKKQANLLTKIMLIMSGHVPFHVSYWDVT